MKDIGFDLTRLAAGLAAFYQPWAEWKKDPNGKIINANPNYDEPRFRYYYEQARDGARDFAAYESPRLSAMVVNAQTTNEFVMKGGLPDEMDGNLPHGSPVIEHRRSEAVSNPVDHAADVPSEPGGGVPAPGEVQGNPLRKAVG
jgi:hypothetical protein